MEFGIEKGDTIERPDVLFFPPPAEVDGIRRGVFHEYIGLFINDGFASWTAFDLDRQEAVRIVRYRGDKLRFAPEETPPEGKKVRQIIAGMETVDIVTRKQLDAAHLNRLVFLANELWVSHLWFPDFATDIHNAIILLDGKTMKTIGGPGLLPPGAADALGKELRALFETDDPDAETSGGIDD